MESCHTRVPWLDLRMRRWSRGHGWLSYCKGCMRHCEGGLVALYLWGGGIVPPLHPRACVVPNLRIPEEPEGPVGHRGALAGLAVRDNLFVLGDALALIHGLQSNRILQQGGIGEVLAPVDVHRARDVAAVLSTHLLTPKFFR